MRPLLWRSSSPLAGKARVEEASSSHAMMLEKSKKLLEEKEVEAGRLVQPILIHNPPSSVDSKGVEYPALQSKDVVMASNPLEGANMQAVVEEMEVGESQGLEKNLALNEKISQVLVLLGDDCQNVELNSLIEVGKELVELAEAAKYNPWELEEDEMAEDFSLGHDVFGFLEDPEGLGTLLGKKRKSFSWLESTRTKLGLCQKNLFKSSPDCEENKKRGISNMEKQKWDGEANG